MIPTDHTDQRRAGGGSPRNVQEPDVEVVTRCPLCGCAALNFLFAALDTLHGLPGEWGIRRCDDCGLMLTSPRPDRTAIAQFYPADYQPFSAPHAQADNPTRMNAFKRLFDPKEHVLPQRIRPGRALEVGCGSGRYLARLAADGWDVQGLEPSGETVKNILSKIDVPISVGTIESATLEEASFDLIVAVMVLEHLHSPVEDVKKLFSWLRPGSYLTGSVPNCGSWEFKFFGSDWYALQVPTHLFHYTPATLTAVLKHSGFTRVKIVQQRNVNNLMVHLGRFLDRRQLPGASTCLRFPEQGSVALRSAVRPAASMLAWLGQAGRISFTAQKSSTE